MGELDENNIIEQFERIGRTDVVLIETALHGPLCSRDQKHIQCSRRYLLHAVACSEKCSHGP